ncbi:MAG: response regulator [Gammaproteobacteria bacterium]|nr:response regulator [Gammaproteobacteria bacterium]
MLLVDDSPEDVVTTLRGFRKVSLDVSIYHCSDGDEALDYLYRREKYAGKGEAPRPDLILLDLNMPGTDGYEVLETIKSDTELKKMPVVVLTTSKAKQDVDRCYSSGANAYVCKPIELRDFRKAIQCLNNFWFQIATLPGAN